MTFYLLRPICMSQFLILCHIWLCGRLCKNTYCSHYCVKGFLALCLSSWECKKMFSQITSTTKSYLEQITYSERENTKRDIIDNIQKYHKIYQYCNIEIDQPATDVPYFLSFSRFCLGNDWFQRCQLFESNVVSFDLWFSTIFLVPSILSV